MSDKEDHKYWCSEGYGFVNKDHRCEQWCSISYIPIAAFEEIITDTKEAIKKKLDKNCFDTPDEQKMIWKLIDETEVK